MCERFLGHVRPGCLERFLTLRERRSDRMLPEYVARFNGSTLKPHGHARGFRMPEWIPDLGTTTAPAQPSPESWLRRLYLRRHPQRPGRLEAASAVQGLLRREDARRDSRLRVLDVVCGGAHYMRDFSAGAGDTLDVLLTLVDQGRCRAPTSLAGCRERLVAISVPVQQPPEVLPAGDFDVTVSTRPFNCLRGEPAR